MSNSLKDQLLGMLTEDDMMYVASTDANLTIYLTDILEVRLKEIENKVYKKNKRIDTTLAQQILILKYLGVIEKITELIITNEKKGKLLSALLNVDAENAEKALRVIYNEKDSPLLTVPNYNYLVTLFKELELVDKVKVVENKLNDIKQKRIKSKR